MGISLILILPSSAARRHKIPLKPLPDDAHLVEILAAHREDVDRIGLRIHQFLARQDDLVDPVRGDVAQEDALLDAVQAEVETALGDLRARFVLRDVVNHQ